MLQRTDVRALGAQAGDRIVVGSSSLEMMTPSHNQLLNALPAAIVRKLLVGQDPVRLSL